MVVSVESCLQFCGTFLWIHATLHLDISQITINWTFLLSTYPDIGRSEHKKKKLMWHSHLALTSKIDPQKITNHFFCLACHYCMMCVQLLFLYFWSLWSFIIHGHKGQKKFGMCRFCNYRVLLIRPSLDFINSLGNFTLKTSP